MEEHTGKKSSRPYPVKEQRAKSIRIPVIRQRRYMFARIKLRDRVYLSRYSQEQTVSMDSTKAFERAGADVDVKVFKT